METFFAPATRADKQQITYQVSQISHNPIMNTLLKTMSGLMIVLNEDRQIVAMNYDFLKSIGISDPEKVLGLRLGESLQCIHAYKEPAGSYHQWKFIIKRENPGCNLARKKHHSKYRPASGIQNSRKYGD